MTVRARSALVQRWFTEPGQDVLASTSWVTRDGREVPASWSRQAADVAGARYLRGAEVSVKQMLRRVCGTIAAWGAEAGYFAGEEERAAFEDELTAITLHQLATFNSPVWFNVGIEAEPQCASTFVFGVEDGVDGALDLARDETAAHLRGGGTGSNLSALRGSCEAGVDGGRATGPLAFLRVLDRLAGVVAESGPLRRAARMAVLDVDHPDVEDFIWAKAEEEDKAKALAQAGFDGPRSVDHQHTNHSVRVTDAFMRAVVADEGFDLVARADGRVARRVRARALFDDIAAAAWRCADPALQFHDTIDAAHTCPSSGPLRASNSCSEFMGADDTAANLASINLMHFRRADGNFDVEAFTHCVDVMTLAQDIVVGASGYPTARIAERSRRYRHIGLGPANLGGYLMARGIPYDSDRARRAAAAITALLTGRAYFQSARIAAALGPYDAYERDAAAHHAVIGRHVRAVGELATDDDPWLGAAARDAWASAVEAGEAHGYRNAQVTLCAPTGTTSFLMGCDTTGIEPCFALVTERRQADGGTARLVPGCLPDALRALGYDDAEAAAILAHVADTGAMVGAPHIAEHHLPVFDVAVGPRAIAPLGHVEMMAAIQPLISGAISKTVNLPASASTTDIADVYLEAWRRGVKAIAVYRDGSKVGQTLSPLSAEGPG